MRNHVDTLLQNFKIIAILPQNKQAIKIYEK